jgi:hypothetical protein
VDKETSVTVVKSLYNGNETLIDVELEITKAGGSKGYRPYLVAAKLMMFEYRQIVKADEVTFKYNEDTVRNLLQNQKTLDADLTDIPENQNIDIFLNNICQTCDEVTTEESYLGAMVI